MPPRACVQKTFDCGSCWFGRLRPIGDPREALESVAQAVGGKRLLTALVSHQVQVLHGSMKRSRALRRRTVILRRIRREHQRYIRRIVPECRAGIPLDSNFSFQPQRTTLRRHAQLRFTTHRGKVAESFLGCNSRLLRSEDAFLPPQRGRLTQPRAEALGESIHQSGKLSFPPTQRLSHASSDKSVPAPLRMFHRHVG
jgi:hypothetical protein